MIRLLLFFLFASLNLQYDNSVGFIELGYCKSTHEPDEQQKKSEQIQNDNK